MMKTGFSSLVCPGWNLETIVTNATNCGFDGVELRGLRGELYLPRVPELTSDPDGVRKLFQENNVELVCLGSSVTFDSRKRADVIRSKSELTEFMELAAKLGCKYVRIFVGEVQRWDNLPAAQARIAEALLSLVPLVTRHGVTVLVENGGDFPSSETLWFLADAVDHPGVRCCWNQCNAKTVGERPTVSIPRLGNKVGMIHLCDATFDQHGVLGEYKPLGEGDTEVSRQIELLKGLAYDGYLIFEWPKMWVASLPAPEEILPGVAKFIRERLDEKQPILTAYKKDKNAPTMRSR